MCDTIELTNDKGGKCMNKLQRDDKIKLHLDKDNKWIIKDVNGNTLVDSDTEYMIYMINVNFKNGNLIEGRYLGHIDKNSPLLQVDNAKVATTNGSEFVTDGKRVRTAKMVVINNNDSVVIVIASR